MPSALSSKVQEKLLPCVSLLPLAGFLVQELSSFRSLLTVGGAIALAYLSATSHWRNYIPDFVTNPLGEEEKKDDDQSPEDSATIEEVEEAQTDPSAVAADGEPTPSEGDESDGATVKPPGA